MPRARLWRPRSASSTGAPSRWNATGSSYRRTSIAGCYSRRSSPSAGRARMLIVRGKELPMTTISPWLSVSDATGALAFYRSAFGAAESDLLEEDGAVIVVRLSIDGAGFWVQHDPDASPEVLNGMSVRMILTVDDPDA